MLLLSPTPALIAAAITVPLLLLIYFLKLRRRPLRVSSTLLWEQAAKDLQVNVPFRWLRVSIVFFLQLAALAALLFALARPAIKGDAPLADRVIIVIDHSASMSARDGSRRGPDADSEAPPTRLDDAKARAIELVRQLARGTTSTGERPSAMIVASATTARVIQPLTTLTADLIDAINAIEPTDQPGDIAAAAELLDAARAATPENVRRSEQIVAFTDLPPSITPDTRGLPIRLIRITTAPTAEAATADSAAAATSPARPTDNLGIAALSVRRDLENPDTIRVFARIVGTNTQPTPVVVRCLFEGGSAAAAKRIDLPAPTPGSASEAGVSFEFPQRSAGVVLVTFDRADLLDADNAAAATIGPVTTPAILVVAPAASDRPQPDADLFLVGFLESLRPRSLRIVDSATFETEAADALAESRRPWRDFNLIIFDRTAPTAGAIPPQPTISFGAGLPIPGLGLKVPDITSPQRTGGGAVRFDTWRRAHPIMRYVALEPIIISPPPPTIDLTRAAAVTSAQSAITPLAQGPDGPLIAALEEPGAGTHRIVVSFPLIRSNWAPDTSFAVFMANAVDQLTGRGEAAIGRAYTTAEPITVHATPRATAIQVVGPRTLSFDVPAADADAPAAPRPVTLGLLDRAGVYRLTGADEAVVCVNLLNESETLLGGLGNRPADTASAAIQPASSESAATDDPNQPDGRREIWHWFVLLAIAIATVEWLVFARQVRA